MTFAELVQEYKNILTPSRTSPASLWDRFWLEDWEEADGKEKSCRGAELEEMGQTDETDAPVLCQLLLGSPAQGTTCTKARLPFSAAPVQRCAM